jgi:HEAT repeat protein
MSSEIDNNDDLYQAALNDLHNSDYKRWRQAFDLLLRSEDSQLAPALIGVLRENRDWFVRINAAKALGDLGALEALSALIEALNGDDEWLAAAAAEALGKLGKDDAVPSLVTALRAEKSLRILSDAVIAHKERMARKDFPKNADATEFYRPDILQFDDDIYAVRVSAAQALGRIGSNRALEGLAEALSFQDEQSSAIRTIVITLLSEAGTQNALDLLGE